MVPRTFIAPIFLSSIALVPKLFLNLTAYHMLHVIRLLLGATLGLSLLRVRNALSMRYNAWTAACFTLLTVCQFHVPFYASRPLPNVFAFIMTNLALADRLVASTARHGYRAIAVVASAVALFRSELSLYLLPTVVSSTWSDPGVKFIPACAVAFITASFTAILSVIVDSHFWRRFAYPELEVFYFNVVLNKSSAWGTEPWHWYFSNAIPRASGGALFLALISVITSKPRVGCVLLPSLIFVAIYSFLPHKELRFVLYAIPPINVAAAITIAHTARMSLNAIRASGGSAKERTVATRRKSAFQALFYLSVTGLGVITVVASSVQTVVSIAASRYNYPAAHALRRMHAAEERFYSEQGFCKRDDSDAPVTASVHIDVDSAMNGITQYVYKQSADFRNTGSGQPCPAWTYFKDEGVSDSALRTRFTHLVSERRYVDGFCVVLAENGYAGVDWSNLRLRVVPRSYIHRNTNISTTNCLPRPTSGSTQK